MWLLLWALLQTGRWAAIVLPDNPADDELAQNLSDVLIAKIADRTHAPLAGREELRTQLGLTERGVLGCAGDTACLGRVGVALQIDKMVVGTISRGIGDELIVNLNLIDVSRLRTERGELRRVHGVPALVGEIQALADAFTGGAPTPVPSPGAGTASPEAVGRGTPVGEVQGAPLPERPVRYRKLAWGCVIGGGVSILGALALGAAAASKANDLKDASSTSSPPLFDSRLQAIQSDGKALQSGANLLWAVGVLAEGTAGVLFYLGRPVLVQTNGTSVALSGSF
jgi:hypothetical protein